jgi:hypothetical protein
MTAKQPNLADHMTESRIPHEDYKLDLPMVLRQLRVCRSTLGSILEFLENNPVKTETLEQISGSSTDIAADVERLWNLIRPGLS